MLNLANKQLLIRADASLEIGMGHRVRCQILADLFREKGWLVSFVCHASCRQMSADEDIFISHEDIFLEMAAQADLVILDHYQYDSKMIEALYKAQSKLLLIDDMNDRGALYCRWLLNPISLDYQANFSDLKRSYQEIPELFLGLDYALLRPQFRERSLGSSEKLLITLGGTDPLSLTLPILTCLNSLGFRSENMLVMLGQNAKGAGQVIAFCRQQNIEYHQGVREVAALMDRAKMAISAGGSTLFELAAMNVPSIFLQIADNQTELLKEHESYGWCRVHRMHDKEKNVRSLMVAKICEQVLEDWDDTDYLSQCQSRIPHSQHSGLDQILENIESTL